ncbi:PorV/PorQ family protein [Neolewinella antarctica]|uniref:PorV/PorQ family protein n=1 Tax=Neolewinella antarctica TaxID=442734 RepID=A0ABX0X7M3_9BACT|nr:hypothetical protein [Neolewinella antarctica]NJC25003.1 hypothetical protein [Neolewinella antarctica]
MRSGFFLFSVILLLITNLHGQDGVIPVFDARSQFMGGTGVAATGLDALWTNPAGFGALRKGEVGAGAGAEQRWGISELTVANAGVTYGTGFGGFGVQLASFGFDGYRENRLGLSYGRQITEQLSIGADFHGFTTSTEGYASSFNVTFGLGARLQVIKDLAVGARIFSPFRSERLPDEYLPQILAIGATYTPTDQLTFNLEAHQDTDHPVRFRAGLEYLPAEQIRIRLGVATEASELSFGVGYVVGPGIELNIGSVYHEVLGLRPGFGMRWLGQ